ncbi:MAG: amidophosphoribosyltransferase [Myxococcota bacterium]|jgi:amidophosphoribosyltransferase|nr:amidophosphoribosyltransferase [Myxococcota bacterium]
MCGVVGLIGTAPVAPPLLLGLQAIQHRGQDAAGIGVFSEGRIRVQKDLGMITQIFDQKALDAVPGRLGIAHVRYPTTGNSVSAEDAQPFLSRRPGMLLAHNGNLVNKDQVNQELLSEGLHVLSESDAETILMVMAQAMTQIRPSNHTVDDLKRAVGSCFQRLRGAYTTVVALELDGEEVLAAFRDPHGIRPGVYGRKGDAWMVASESVALDVLGFNKVGDLPAGSLMIFREGREPLLAEISPLTPRPCIFERIYFARPDSLMEDGRVNRTRWRLGRALAEQWLEKGLTADVVMAVPDTSRPAAMAISDTLKIPNREGFIKNRYSGRTFIMPDQSTRNAALRLKLNPIPEMFENKRVLLIDDSVVRGSTMRRIVEMIRGLSPREVHLGIFSPPVTNPCFYGIDMPSRDELLASKMSEDEMAEHFGADSVTYLSVDNMKRVASNDICAACFTGDYVVPIHDNERRLIHAQRRPGGGS